MLLSYCIRYNSAPAPKATWSVFTLDLGVLSTNDCYTIIIRIITLPPSLDLHRSSKEKCVPPLTPLDSPTSRTRTFGHSDRLLMSPQKQSIPCSPILFPFLYDLHRSTHSGRSSSPLGAPCLTAPGAGRRICFWMVRLSGFMFTAWILFLCPSISAT